jgi:hypothetical protein
MRYYYFLFFFVCSIILPQYVYAFEISPLGYHVTAEVNTVENFTFTIRNTTATAQTYNVSIRDGVDISTSSPFATWVTLPPAITLPPGASATADLIVTVPPNATPGDKYFAVTLSTQVDSDVSIPVQSEVVVPITITVAGSVSERIDLTYIGVEVLPRQVLGRMTLLHIGTTATPIRGTFHIRTLKDTVAMLPVEQIIRAGTESTYNLNYDRSLWYIGPMWIEFDGVYGVFDTPITGSQRVYVVGVYSLYICILGVAGLLAMIGIGWYYIRKRYPYEDTTK